MPVGLDPASWHELAATFASVCGALLGLLFVAMALHVQGISGNRIVRARARVSLQSLALAVVQSLLILVPRQATSWLGLELIASELLYVALVVPGIAALQVAPGVSAGLRLRSLIVAVVILLTFGAGVSLALGRGPGLLLQVPAVLITIVLGAWQAWNVMMPAELPGDATAGRPPVPQDAARLARTKARRRR